MGLGGWFQSVQVQAQSFGLRRCVTLLCCCEMRFAQPLIMQFDRSGETSIANKLKDNMEINKTKVLEGQQNKKSKK